MGYNKDNCNHHDVGCGVRRTDRRPVVKSSLIYRVIYTAVSPHTRYQILPLPLRTFVVSIAITEPAAAEHTGDVGYVTRHTFLDCGFLPILDDYAAATS